jgi:class 3 adenylate cyclase
MLISKNFLGVCLIFVLSFDLFLLEGMRRHKVIPEPKRISSEPKMIRDDLSVVGRSHKALRPTTSLGFHEKATSKIPVRRLVPKPLPCPSLIPDSADVSSDRSDSTIEVEDSSGASSPQDFGLSVRSIANRERLNRIFDRWRYYVDNQKALLLNKLISASLRAKALKTGLKDLRAGKRTESAVLFCDIRNFTSITELNDPQNIMGMLNEYFGSIVKIISKNHGVVDKFIGDAILAEFFCEETITDESTSDRNNVCLNAVKSALEIIDFTKSFDLTKFNLKDDDNQNFLKDNRLSNGIGITFGNIVFGALGSEDRCELTVIGDEVNLASRLQDLNKNPDISKKLERPIIISQAVHNLLPKIYEDKFISLGAQHIKGKRADVLAFGYGKILLDSEISTSVHEDSANV